MNALSALYTLHDVPGVLGGFFTTADGTLLANNMPPFFDATDLRTVAPRLLGIVAGCREAGLERDVEHCILRYADYHLHLRPEADHLLCVLCEPHANLPALRMACRLVARKLGRDVTAPTPPTSTRRPSTRWPSVAEPIDEEPVTEVRNDVAPTLSSRSPAAPHSVPPIAEIPDSSSGQPSSSGSEALEIRTPSRASPEARGMPTTHLERPARTILYRGRKYQV